MITAYGRRRLKKIALTIMVLVLCVQFMVFITSTFYRQRPIYMPESPVCECQIMGDFKNIVRETRTDKRVLEKKSTHEISEHIEGKRDRNTGKRIRKFSIKPKVALTRTMSLGLVSQPAAKITTMKSDAIIAKTNVSFSRTKVGVSKINMALSTTKYISTLEENRAFLTPSAQKSPTITERSIAGTPLPSSTPEQKIPQFGTRSRLPTFRNVSPKPTVKKTPINDEKVPAQGLTNVKEPTVKVLPSTPTVKSAPSTFQNAPASAEMRKVPQPTVKKLPPQTFQDVKLPTVKAPPILRKIPPKVPSSALKDANLATAKKPSPNSVKATSAPSLTVNRTPPLFKKALPTTARKLAPPTTIKIKSKSKITTANTSDFSWKTLTKTLSIFSSYHDTRYLKTTTPYGFYQSSLVIFGYELSKFTNNLLCVVIMDDNKRLLVKQPAVRIILSELWKHMWNKYRAIMYRCNLTMPGSPRYVTLIDSESYNNIDSIPPASFIPAVNSHSPVVHEFGVCYETPLHGNKYDQGIMDSIEMNKILGATWFTLYVCEADDKALEILKYYSQELKILDAVLNWGHNMPSPVYNRGLLAGVNDCVYRNMYKVRYLVLCDLDEFIMPVQGLNWHDLLLKIDSANRTYFCFRHLGFHRNQSKATELLACHGQSNLTYKMPRFFATHNRSVSVISKNRQVKSIAKPRYSIVVHVHLFRRMLPGYRPYFVPTDLALMKHFRDKDDPRYTNYNSTLDYSMDRYKPAIFAAIEEHYCRNIKHGAR